MRLCKCDETVSAVTWKHGHESMLRNCVQVQLEDFMIIERIITPKKCVQLVLVFFTWNPCLTEIALTETFIEVFAFAENVT